MNPNAWLTRNSSSIGGSTTSIGMRASRSHASCGTSGRITSYDPSALSWTLIGRLRLSPSRPTGWRQHRTSHRTARPKATDPWEPGKVGRPRPILRRACRSRARPGIQRAVLSDTVFRVIPEKVVVLRHVLVVSSGGEVRPFARHLIREQLPVDVVGEFGAGHRASDDRSNVFARYPSRVVQVVANEPRQVDPDVGERVLAGLTSLSRGADVPVDVVELLRAKVVRRATDRLDPRRSASTRTRPSSDSTTRRCRNRSPVGVSPLERVTSSSSIAFPIGSPDADAQPSKPDEGISAPRSSTVTRSPAASAAASMRGPTASILARSTDSAKPKDRRETRAPRCPRQIAAKRSSRDGRSSSLSSPATVRARRSATRLGIGRRSSRRLP